MKTLIPLFLLFYIPALSAQVIDDSAIDRINNGEVEFAEGRFIAYLADTTTPGYARMIFKQNGLDVALLNFEPVRITLMNFPSEQTLAKMRQDPDITRIQPMQSEIDPREMMDSLEKEGLTKAEISQALQKLQQQRKMGTYLIEFAYELNRDMADQKMRSYPNIAYEAFSDAPRMATLRAEPGKEKEAMQRAEMIPFVEYTALIGMIKD